MVGTPPKASTRRTCSTASPVRSASARATSALARRRRQSTCCARPGLRCRGRRCRAPASGSGTARAARRAWRRRCPCPGGAPRRFSAASSSIALRTVPWLTRKRAASSISLGIGLARLPFAGLQALQDQRLDLLVQRAERRRGRRSARRRWRRGCMGGHGHRRRLRRCWPIISYIRHKTIDRRGSRRVNSRAVRQGLARAPRGRARAAHRFSPPSFGDFP